MRFARLLSHVRTPVPWVAAALFYVAVALFQLYPAWTDPARGVVGDWTHPDTLGNHWLYRWLTEQLVSGGSILVFVPAALAATVPPLALFLAHWVEIPGVAEAAFPHPITVAYGLTPTFPFWSGTGALSSVTLPLGVTALAIAGLELYARGAAVDVEVSWSEPPAAYVALAELEPGNVAELPLLTLNRELFPGELAPLMGVCVWDLTQRQGDNTWTFDTTATYSQLPSMVRRKLERSAGAAAATDTASPDPTDPDDTP